jgi:hypothetical protein
MTLRALGQPCFALSVSAILAAANAQGVARHTDRHIARAQNQLNRHFSNAVVTPALRECWSRLQGDARFRPKVTMSFEKTLSESGDNSKGNRNLETICRCILPSHLLHFLSNPLLNVGILSINDG